MNDSITFYLLKYLEASERLSSAPLLTLRLVTLMIVVVLLTVHLRTVRVFRWELSVSGGLLITYCIATLGLAVCAGVQSCGGRVLQAYLCAVGAALFATNAAVLWQRWQHSGQLTQVVAEMLQAVGVPLRRQVILKVALSASTALILLLDLILAPMLSP